MGWRNIAGFDSFQAITFDCYGTLIDWESGILRVLRPLLAEHGKPMNPNEILEVYAELEPALQAARYRPYRSVLEEVMRAFGQHFGFSVSTDEARSLAASIKNWIPFADTVGALAALKGKFRLGIISNIDDTCSKTPRRNCTSTSTGWSPPARPAPTSRRAPSSRWLCRRSACRPEEVLHAGQSVFHDVIPAKQMGMSTVLVTRRGPGAVKRVSAKPDLEVPDLKTLAEMAVGKGSATRAG